MPDHSLNNKVALITGAARRMGEEMAKTLHDAGMNIVLHYNTSENEAKHLCQKLNEKRANSAILLRADLQAVDCIPFLIEKSIAAFHQLDVLINNASRFYRTMLGSSTDYAWEDLMSANLKAPYFLAEAAAPHLQKTKGTIINIADIHGETPMRDYGIYCISKSGLFMMTKVLAKELAPHVRVNTVAPGIVSWPEGKNELEDNIKNKIIDQIALKRPGKLSDIAKAVLYLVRDADYVTGQVIYVDGGRLL